MQVLTTHVGSRQVKLEIYKIIITLRNKRGQERILRRIYEIGTRGANAESMKEERINIKVLRRTNVETRRI